MKGMKWTVTLGAAVAGGVVAYSIGHKGPPLSVSDFWDLLVVTLITAGFGAGARGANKAIDNKSVTP